MKAKVGLWLFVGLVFDVVSMLRFAWVGVSSKNLFVVASVCLGVGLSSVPLSFRGGASRSFTTLPNLTETTSPP